MLVDFKGTLFTAQPKLHLVTVVSHDIGNGGTETAAAKHGNAIGLLGHDLFLTLPLWQAVYHRELGIYSQTGFTPATALQA